MDRRTGSTFTRRRNNACALTLALCAAGCGGNNYYVRIGSDLAPGGAVSAGVSPGATVSASSTSSSSAYFILGMMLRMAYAAETASEAYGLYGAYPVAVPPHQRVGSVG